MLAALLLLASQSVTAADIADGSAAVAGDDLDAYYAALESAELRGGAYNDELTEPLLGLAMALQARGEHGDALALFKRGAHLARINDGLHSSRQIPLLRGEIASLIASGDYAVADDRQRYLYRVQLRGRERGERLAEAYMEHADWQYQAYRLRLESEGFDRLINMANLYQAALKDVVEHEGDTSPAMLPPLHGLLRAQYLIAGYDLSPLTQAPVEDVRARQNLYRFAAYKRQSYATGQSIIQAMHDISSRAPDARQRVLDSAHTLAMLGDWHLWNDQPQAAERAYAEAWAELAGLDDAQDQASALLGAPVALPALAGLEPLPPEAQDDPAAVQLMFSITASGRTRSLRRLDENAELDGRALRLMRTLRTTRFRPRFEAGQPAETQQLVKAFDLK